MRKNRADGHRAENWFSEMQMNWAHLQETEKEYPSISIAVEFTENRGNGKPIEIWSRDVESDIR